MKPCEKAVINRNTIDPNSGGTDATPTTHERSVSKEIKTDELLSQAEGLKRFEELDRLIVSGFTQSLIGSRALREMEQGQYYIFGGFKTIADYGSKTRNLAKSTVYQYVNAGRVANVIDESTACRLKPVNEAQLRPLLNVDDDEKVIAIWNTAVTLYGEGGLTETAVARAKCQVLRLDAKPKEVGVEETLRTISNGIRRCWDARQGGRCKLLDNLLLLLKSYYDELPFDGRSPRLTAIFKRVDSEETELQAIATEVSYSMPPDGPTADFSTLPSGPAISSMTVNKTAAQIVKPQTPRKTTLATVKDHLSKLREGFDSIAVELHRRQATWPKGLRNADGYKARERTIPSVEALTKQLAQIVASSGVAGDLPFSTKIMPRGSRAKRLRRMTEIVAAIATSIQDPAPQIARELQHIAAELTRIHSRGGL